MSNKKIDLILNRFDKVKKDRMNVDTVWQTISDYVLTHPIGITEKELPGNNKRRDVVFDDTAPLSAAFLASAIHSGLTSPSLNWIKLTRKQKNIKGKNVDDRPDISRWLEMVSNELLDIFNSSNSAFPHHNHEYILSAVTFGTACIFVEDSITDGIKFSTLPMREIFILEDKYGDIDTVFRNFKMTKRQMAQMWGEKNHPNTMREIEQKPEESHDILHVCMPRSETTDLPNKGFKYVSYYIDISQKHIINTHGYYDCPYIVSRFSKLAGEVYGRSPAWQALPSIRLINKIKENLLAGSQMSILPPLLIADDGVMLPKQPISPGMKIVGGLSHDGLPKIQPLNTGARIDIGIQFLELQQKAIRDAFFVDALVFRDGGGQPATATEIIQRQQESLKLLAPYISRFQTEYLTKLINTVFSMKARAGHFGTVPDDIVMNGYEIDYLAPIALLQKISEVQKFQQFINNVAPIAQLNPESIQMINFDRVMENIAEDIGIWKSALRTPKELEQMRSQQQQQAMAQQGLNAGLQLSEINKNLQQPGGGQ